MAEGKWKLEAFDGSWEKYLTIWSPNGIEIRVDYDDVDHQEAERVARAIVREMNKVAKS
jgi:hypothetical protein